MTVMKGGIVSETQDIRIAKFTNEVSLRIRIQKQMLQLLICSSSRCLPRP